MLLLRAQSRPIQMHINMACHFFISSRSHLHHIISGGIVAHDEDGNRYVLFIGIIDILQSYVMKKKLEHTWKALVHDGVC